MKKLLLLGLLITLPSYAVIVDATQTAKIQRTIERAASNLPPEEFSAHVWRAITDTGIPLGDQTVIIPVIRMQTMLDLVSKLRFYLTEYELLNPGRDTGEVPDIAAATDEISDMTYRTRLISEYKQRQQLPLNRIRKIEIEEKSGGR